MDQATQQLRTLQNKEGRGILLTTLISLGFILATSQLLYLLYVAVHYPSSVDAFAAAFNSVILCTLIGIWQWHRIAVYIYSIIMGTYLLITSALPLFFTRGVGWPEVVLPSAIGAILWFVAMKR